MHRKSTRTSLFPAIMRTNIEYKKNRYKYLNNMDLIILKQLLDYFLRI